MTFYKQPGLGSHAAAQRGIASQANDGLGPLLGRGGQKPGAAVQDHLAVHAHWIGHHRQPGGHVLQHLQTTFAQAPGIVGQPTDTDVGLGQQSGFVGLGPAAGNHPDFLKLGKTVADDFQFQPGQPPPAQGKRPFQIVQAGERALLANPDQLHLVRHAQVGAYWVAPGIEARGHQKHPLRVGQFRGAPNQIRITGQHAIGRVDRGPEMSQAVPASGAAAAVAVAVEQGVVEVVNQHPGAAAQQAQLPEGEQLPLEDDHVGPFGPKKLPRSGGHSGGQRYHFQRPAAGLQVREQGGDAIAVANVLGLFDQSQQLHGVLPDPGRHGPLHKIPAGSRTGWEGGSYRRRKSQTKFALTPTWRHCLRC